MMAAPDLGLVAIGQTPRVDVTSTMRSVLGDDVELLEEGVLDGLDAASVAALAPGRDDPFPLVSRLADGTQCCLDKHRLPPLLESRFHRVKERGAEVAVLLCTSVFEGLRFPPGLFVLEAGRVVDHWIAALARPDRVMGLMVPLPAQEAAVAAHYADLPLKGIRTASASPYGPAEAVARAAEGLRDVDFVVTHCMGFTTEHKRLIRAVCGRPVLQATGVLARTASELLGA